MTIAATLALALQAGLLDGGAGLNKSMSVRLPDGSYTDLQTILTSLATGADGGNAAAAAIKVHLSQTIAFGDFAALLAGVKTKDYTLSAGLPTNSKLLALPYVDTFTGFDDNGGGGTATIVLGTSTGGAEIGTSLNVALGQSGFAKQFTAATSIFPTVSLSGLAVKARFTSNHDLNTFTAGSCKLHVFYFVLP